MKYLRTFIFLLAFTAFCSSAQSQAVPGRFDRSSQPPAFTDKAKALAHLMNEFKCEALEFENWEEDDKTDEDLTICIVNSKLIGKIDPTENSLPILQMAAKKIKPWLAYPGKYKALNVIFVTDANGLRSHTLGSRVPTSTLKLEKIL